jgi:hypothetical protein
MNAICKFAPVPSHSIVAGLVTSLVCAWFLMAAAAIFADPAAAHGETALAQSGTPAPEARLTITVEAPRLKS